MSYCKHGNSSQFCGWCEDQAEIARLTAERDALLEALRECELTLRVMGHDSEPLARMATNARAAIARATVDAARGGEKQG